MTDEELGRAMVETEHVKLEGLGHLVQYALRMSATRSLGLTPSDCAALAIEVSRSMERTEERWSR